MLVLLSAERLLFKPLYACVCNKYEQEELSSKREKELLFCTYCLQLYLGVLGAAKLYDNALYVYSSSQWKKLTFTSLLNLSFFKKIYMLK